MNKTEKINLPATVLEILVDGQWHPLYKLKKKLNIRSSKAETLLVEHLETLAGKGKVIAGNNNSYRLDSQYLKNVIKSGDVKINDKNKPRYYGGILEDDGWLLAPLQEYDMVHFRMDNLISSTQLKKILNNAGYHINIDNNTHLVRVFAPSGGNIREVFLELKETHPELGIHSIRLESNLKRRMLTDLPDQFVAGICEKYGKFAQVLLRAHMSSVRKHIKEQDDIQQQIYLWVIEAIQRYDAETSIPFAAYLSSSLKKWVFNLARESYGRAIADTEIKHARIINKFVAENGREPNLSEISTLLGNSADGVNKDRFAMASVSNILNTTTIHHEDGDLQIEAEHGDNVAIEKLTNLTLISASLLNGISRSKEPNVSLLYVYYKSWGANVRNKKITAFLSNPPVKRSGEAAIKRASDYLKNDERM
jgi:DNA-directed RNA polymerase specialized sigma subunit